jgi:transcriptional regulator with XRE-family HTH domain
VPRRAVTAPPDLGPRSQLRELRRTHNGETFGQRLKRLRGDLSQRELAEACEGVSYAYISRLEAGARSASVSAIREMAAALGVSTDYLEYGRVDDTENAALQRRITELTDELASERARADRAEERARGYAVELRRRQ